MLARPWATPNVERSYGDRIVASVEADRTYLRPELRARPVYVVLDSRVPSGIRLSEVDAGDLPVYKPISTAR